MSDRLVPCILVIAATLAAPSVARADDRATAHALFEEGVRLYERGDYAGSCAKLEASSRLLPTSGTSLNLGRCHEAQNELIKAWNAFEEATVLARRDNNASRAEFAHTNAERLRPLLPRVRVTSEPGNVVEARLDGAPIDSAALGVAIPVEAGKHALEARAPGRRPWKTTFEAVSGKETSIVVPRLEAEPTSLPAPAPAPAEPERGWSTWKIASVAIGATGLAATGLGLGFGGYAASLKSEGDDHCAPKCDAVGRAYLHDAGTWADASTVVVSVGAALLVAGVVLWMVAPSPKAGDRRAAWALGIAR